MREIIPFTIGWTSWNGFNLDILRVEIYSRRIDIDGALFGINFSKKFLCVDFLFMYFEVKAPIIKLKNDPPDNPTLL